KTLASRWDCHPNLACSGTPCSGRGGRRFKSCHSDQHLAKNQFVLATGFATGCLYEHRTEKRAAVGQLKRRLFIATFAGGRFLGASEGENARSAPVGEPKFLSRICIARLICGWGEPVPGTGSAREHHGRSITSAAALATSGTSSSSSGGWCDES